MIVFAQAKEVIIQVLMDMHISVPPSSLLFLLIGGKVKSFIHELLEPRFNLSINIILSIRLLLHQILQLQRLLVVITRQSDLLFF